MALDADDGVERRTRMLLRRFNGCLIVPEDGRLLELLGVTSAVNEPLQAYCNYAVVKSGFDRP